MSGYWAVSRCSSAMTCIPTKSRRLPSLAGTPRLFVRLPSTRISPPLSSHLPERGPALIDAPAALAHVGYLVQRDDDYALSRLARRTLLRGAAMDVTGYVPWHETQSRFMEQMETLMRTG